MFRPIFGLFLLIFAYSYLFRSIMGCSTFYKKVKAHKAREILEALKKVKAREKVKARKACKAHKN